MCSQTLIETDLSSDDSIEWLDPIAHGLALDLLQKRLEPVDEMSVPLKVVPMLVDPVS